MDRSIKELKTSLDKLIKEQSLEFSSADRQMVRERVKFREPAKSTSYKRAIGVLFAILITFSIYILNQPSSRVYAAINDMPFFHSIFTFLGDSGLKLADEKKVTTPIEKIQKHDGVTMKIDEAVFDGKRLSISYSIKQREAIEHFNLRKMNIHIPYEKDSEIKSSNKFTQINKNKMIGVATFTFTNKIKKDQFDAQFLYKATSDHTYKWEKDFSFNFNIPIKKVTKTKTIKINKKKTFDGNEVSLDSISISPLTTSLKLTYKEPYKSNRLPYYGVLLTNQDGKVIRSISNIKGGEWAQEKEGDTWKTVLGYDEYFEALDENVEFINVQLIKMPENRFEVSSQRKIPLNRAMPFLIDMGDFAEAEILKLERKKQTLTVQYKLTSKFAFFYDDLLLIRDSKGKLHYGSEQNIRYLGNDTYLIDAIYINVPDEELKIEYFIESVPEVVKNFEIEIPNRKELTSK